MEEERIVSSQTRDQEDAVLDMTLRPRTLAEYIGQSKVKQNLEIFMAAAKKRKEPIEHVLLYGPPGLGKTTLAGVIANEMGVNIKVTSGPAMERAGDVAAILTNLQEGDILFIDEIHRLHKTVEEILYPAMEDYSLDLIVGKGPSARVLKLDLPRFTLIGATTRISMLSSPLRDRFGAIHPLSFYEEDEIGSIIGRSAKILSINMEKSANTIIAQRSRRTPRIANRLLKRVRDYADVKADGVVTESLAHDALDMLEVDALGLDMVDRKILLAIIEKFGGGPVGLGTLAASTGEEESTIEDIYEPFLMQLGFLERTPRGRMATERGHEHLGTPLNARPGLFG
ncbi:MAG: Holliday junction branch migration DNA helicase RuvB [Patescibacteria group bacterium]|nr:Holliday junction branch migration DNA helicase RuvB [bacterium]MDZ4221645.1 Holliday junction branch migration DNA helicase RuvB [Patescibacteria group bacterium]